MTSTVGVRPAPPTAEELASLLGPASELWIALQERVRAATAPASVSTPVTQRWVYGGVKYGWSCRLERGKKGIVYLTPDAGHFRAGLALSDAAREAVLAADLPAQIHDALAAAAKAMEGWPVRMPVRTASDLTVALRLIEIKLAN
jgi:hypothetical protein